MRVRSFMAWGALVGAFVLWGAFGFLVWTLYGERAEYAEAQENAAEESLRGESLARLRATVQDTQVERASLESLLDIGILDAVKMLETASAQAGATSVSVGAVTPSSVGQDGLGDVTAYSVVVHAQGPFTALMRLTSLFETLTIPSTLEQFEMERAENTWRLTARVKLILSSDVI